MRKWFLTTTHMLVCIAVTLAALVCFVAAVYILGFQCHLTCCGDDLQKKSAAWFALIWAVGLPVWFAVERAVWGKTEEVRKRLDISQDHIRDFWLGLGAIILVLADKRFFD